MHINAYNVYIICTHTHNIYIYNIKAFGDDKVIQVATVSQVTQPMPKHGGGKR